MDSTTQDEFLPGDILLYRGRTLLGRFICWWTRSDYCHAAMIGPTGEVLEMYSLSGGRSIPLKDIANEPIDVYRLKQGERVTPAEYTALIASLRMKDAINERYSLRSAIMAGLTFFIRPFRKEIDKHGLHCSQAVSLAYRQAGVDLWPAAPDWATLPEHLARSPFLKRIGKLVQTESISIEP